MSHLSVQSDSLSTSRNVHSSDLALPLKNNERRSLLSPNRPKVRRSGLVAIGASRRDGTVCEYRNYAMIKSYFYTNTYICST